MSEFRENLVQLADTRARLAALLDAADMAQAEPVHEAVRARFHADGMLHDLHIDRFAPNGYTNTELQQIIADVLRTTRARVHRRVQRHARSFFCLPARSDGGTAPAQRAAVPVALSCQLETSVNQVFAWLAGPDPGETRIYAESSRDGAVALALDGSGAALWCRLQPEVNQWAADALAHRILRLYTLALMRSRCDERLRIERRFGRDLAADIFAKAPAAYPDRRAVKRYRQQRVDF